MVLKTRTSIIGWSCCIFSVCASSAYGQGFGIGSYEVLSSNRVGRTEWEYVVRATVTNNVASAAGVSGLLTSTSSNTVVMQGALNVGDLTVGSSLVSTGTFVIRQNRLFPFAPAGLQWKFTAQSMPLTVTLDSPVSGFLTNGTNVMVSGTVGPAVFAVSVGGVLVTNFPGGSNYTAMVPLREGRNTLSAVATNEFGGVGVASVTVNRDTTPPMVNIETPTAGAILTVRQITVTGMINDVVPGTVNPEQATVMVNGLPAMILNRSYAITDLLLAPGKNIINVVARDRAGNDTQRSIEVTVMDAALQKRLNRLAGDAQSGMIGATLPQPLVVELVDANGVAQTNQPVTFNICRSDGQLLSPPDQQGRTITRLTDDRGQAQIFFQLGSRTGAGNNQVEVTSPGVLGQMIFCANATGSPPSRISALLPETQVGETSKPLPQPWTAYVTDSGGNPVAGAPVTFMVFQGDGFLNGTNDLRMLTLMSDSDGRASVVHTLGPEEGINNQVVFALIAGMTNSAATFTATARTPEAAQNTRVTGLVLDNGNRPMSNILCRIENNGAETVTDAQGQFAISNAPVGEVHLFVDARNRGYTGTWHALEFVLVTVAGRDNSVDRPIYMLPLDDESSKISGDAEEVTLQMKGMPGATMTILPHSLRDANNQPITNRVLFTQVNMERVPMPPPLGSQFMLAWTVQPAGLHFDPPAKMCIPNMGAPAGQVVEMFSFDHDLIQFVAIGTATVTGDGALMCSDPGFGVTKSGWGGCVPPPPPPKCKGKPCKDPNPDDCIKVTGDTCPPGCKHENEPNGKVCVLKKGFLGIGRVTGICKDGVCVCPKPVNFRQTAASDSGGGVLHFEYAWDSNTGNLADLANCQIGEIVTYPAASIPFPSPPFPPLSPNNPTIIWVAAAAGTFQDNHSTPGTFVKPYAAASVTATQNYRFRCPCENNNNPAVISGPISIVRSVSQRPDAQFRFTITKSGSSASIDPLP